MLTRRQNDCLMLVIMVSLMIIMVTSCGNSNPPSKFITETYVVRPGDTLWAIAGKYMEKNTYGPREIQEFSYGIVESNKTLFEDRTPGLIYPGDKLQINYWITKDE